MDLLITNARIPRGSHEGEGRVAIRVRGGRIAEIGPGLRPGGEPQLDAGGRVVLPGLIDPHVHLQSVPGATFRGDDEDSRRRAWKHHLKAYLACGVTSVLDAAISAQVLREIRVWLDGGGPGPRVLALGPALYPAGGYLDHNFLTDAWGPIWRPASTPADVGALFEEYQGIADIIGVKVVIEYGFSPFYDWPVHSAEMRTHIRREAAARALPLFVHALQHRAFLVAMTMAPRVLVHAAFVDREPSARLVEQIKSAGTYVITTLSSNFDCWLVRRKWMAGIEDDLIHRVVPSAEIETARDPRAWNAMWRRMFTTIAPRWLPAGAARLASHLFAPALPEAAMRRAFQRACRAIAALDRAGVPVVMGSDAGAWPLVPSCFHGYSTIREMELLAQAGWDAPSIIEASTRRPAKMLGLEDEIGTVEVGRRADMLVLDEDPFADIRAFRSIRWTIKGGDARTPNEWMEA